MKGAESPAKRTPVPARPSLSRRTSSVMRLLDAKPGAEAKPMSASRSVVPSVVLYKIIGKMFAILSVRGEEFVILKCDPNLVPILREQYEGVGHRSHLDRRFWICVRLDADVPPKEIRRLIDHSYGLVSSGLTRKQQAQLAAMAPASKGRKH